MNINFKYDAKRIDLVDHVVRNMDSVDDDGRRNPARQHIQVRLIEKSKKYSGMIYLSITYKDKDGNFLGLDEGSIWQGDANGTKKFHLSVPITVPENAEYAECEISLDATSNDFSDGYYTWVGKIGAFLLLMIVAGWVLQSYEGLFWVSDCTK